MHRFYANRIQMVFVLFAIHESTFHGNGEVDEVEKFKYLGLLGLKKI